MTEVVNPAENAVSKVNLLNFDHQGLREYFASIGEKPFRADQLMKWMYHFGYDDSGSRIHSSRLLNADVVYAKKTLFTFDVNK